MSDYGLTSLGFILKRLVDIQDDLANDLTATFGEIDTSADSVFGQIIGVLAKPLTDLWEQMQVVYYSQYPDTATGVPLDYAVALTGITRQPATYSQGTIGLKGTDGTVVPAFTQVETEVTKYIFQTKIDTTITLTGIASTFVNIDIAEEANDYAVTINGTFNYAYTASHGDTPAIIAAGIKALMDTSLLVNVEDLGDGTLLITAKSSPVNVAVASTVTDGISWWTPASIIALDKGAIPAPAGTINTIINAVSGLDEVRNFDDIDEDSGMGRDVETDSALRLRRLASLKVTGAASVEAIRARILNDVANVSACIVLENPTDVASGGLDPHSIKVVVEGGADLDIGKMIWNVKAGGVKVMGGAGSTSVTFLDSQGNSQTISFFRPITKYAWVDVVIQESDPLLIPVGYATQIQSNILAWGMEHTVGQEIVYQQLFGVVYQVPGILKAQIQIALTDNPGDTPTWVMDNIPIPDQTCYAEFADSRITVA